MEIFIFLGIPMLAWVLVMIYSLVQERMPAKERTEPINPDVDGAPQFTLDYSGRLWIDRRRKGFFRRIRRRRTLPPNETEQ